MTLLKVENDLPPAWAAWIVPRPSATTANVRNHRLGLRTCISLLSLEMSDYGWRTRRLRGGHTPVTRNTRTSPGSDFTELQPTLESERLRPKETHRRATTTLPQPRQIRDAVSALPIP